MRRFQWPTNRWLHRIFLGYVALMVMAFLLPAPSTPLAESHHIDKVVHFGIFAGFAFLFRMDRHRSVWWTFLISAAFAGGIELVQSMLPYRDGDWLDFAAGAAGAGLATILAPWLERQAEPTTRAR